MDWARAIERNSEALKGIIADLFVMLGLSGEATVSRLPRSVHSAVLRVLRPAESAMRRLIIIAARGLVVKLAPTPSRPKPAGPIGKGGGAAGLPPSSSSTHGKTSLSCDSTAKSSRAIPRASISSRMIPCGQRPRPWPIPLRRPMASSTPGASPGGLRPSSWRSRICRARPGVSPAGGHGGKLRQARNSGRRSGLAVLPATAGSRFTSSMRCSSNAMALPGMQ